MSERPLVSLIAPAYNEAEVIEENLEQLCAYMETLEDRYRWELIVVDDGSTDATGELARAAAAKRDEVRVHRHLGNYGLGQALCSGFEQSRGDAIVVVDLDLTYEPSHIAAMLDRMAETRAEIVLASPYMAGGRTSKVPLVRRILSRWGNRFLALTARGANRGGNLSTLTGMVRAYDGDFIRSLNLKSTGVEINTEIIYKGIILGAHVAEVPAHLDWSAQSIQRSSRTSAKRLRRSILFSVLAGFSIRPFAFFIIPAAVLALISVYPIVWIFLHVHRHYQQTALTQPLLDFAISEAVAQAFQQAPHAFIVAGILVTLAVQLFSLGVVSHQVKQYFEEMFHFETRVYAQAREIERMLQEQADRGPRPSPDSSET